MKRKTSKYLIGGWAEFKNTKKIWETVKNTADRPVYAIYNSKSEKLEFRRTIKIKDRLYCIPYYWSSLYNSNSLRLDFLRFDLDPTLDECFEDINQFLDKHLSFDNFDKYVLSLYILSTWFFDRFEFFPALHLLVPKSELYQIENVVASLPFRSLQNFNYFNIDNLQTFFFTIQPTLFFSDQRYWNSKRAVQGFIKRTLNTKQINLETKDRLQIGNPFIPQIILSDSSLPIELDWISIPIAPRLKNGNIDETEVKYIRDRLLSLRFHNLFSKGIYQFKFDNSTRIDKLIEVLLTLYKPEKPSELKLRRGIIANVEERYLFKYSFWPRRIAAFLCVKLENFQNYGRNFVTLPYLASEFKKQNPDFDLSSRYFNKILRYVLNMPVYRTDKSFKLDLTKVDLNSLRDKFDLKFKAPINITSKESMLRSLFNELGYTLYEKRKS